MRSTIAQVKKGAPRSIAYFSTESSQPAAPSRSRPKASRVMLEPTIHTTGRSP